MAEINWTAEAERWLHEINNYLSARNPQAAARTLEGICRKAQLLRDFPELGYRHGVSGPEDIRIILFGHYRIAYVIKADGNIDILGVFHATLDIDHYLP